MAQVDVIIKIWCPCDTIRQSFHELEAEYPFESKDYLMREAVKKHIRLILDERTVCGILIMRLVPMRID